jgi:hypothetical protein
MSFMFRPVWARGVVAAASPNEFLCGLCLFASLRGSIAQRRKETKTQRRQNDKMDLRRFPPAARLTEITSGVAPSRAAPRWLLKKQDWSRYSRAGKTAPKLM